MRITHPCLIHVSHSRWDICASRLGHVTQFSQSNVTLRAMCSFWAEDWSAIMCVLLLYLFYENGLSQVGAAPAAWILDEEKTRMKTKPGEQAADPEMPQPRCEQETNILVPSSWDLMVLIGTASPGGNCTEYAEQNWRAAWFPLLLVTWIFGLNTQWVSFFTFEIQKHYYDTSSF